MKRRASISSAMSLLLATTLASSALAAAGGKFVWTTESAEAKTLLSELQARIENFETGPSVIEIAQKLQAADPSFAMGVYYLSAVIPPPEAIPILERSVELSKRASEGERRFIEAMAHARANNGANFAEAVPMLEKLAQDYPEERLVQMILGQIYNGTGEPAKARAAFERANEIGPESQRALTFIANDDLLKGEYKKARSLFEKVEKNLPETAAPAPLRYGVAFSYLYEGNDEAALEALETFVDEYRNSGAAQGFPEVFIWNSIARIHLENGRTEEAMQAYEKGYASVPGSNLPEDQKTLWHARLKHGTCRTLAKMGRFEEAQAVADEVYEMIEEGGEAGEQYLPAYHYLMGYLKLEEGESADAVQHLKQANPNDPFHQLLLARALEGVGDEESAVKTYERIVESNANGLERALAYPEAKRKLGKS